MPTLSVATRGSWQASLTARGLHRQRLQQRPTGAPADRLWPGCSPSPCFRRRPPRRRSPRAMGLMPSGSQQRCEHDGFAASLRAAPWARPLA
eukprot:2566094-Alexandrium_andersonii.AAC.1